MLVTTDEWMNVTHVLTIAIYLPTYNVLVRRGGYMHVRGEGVVGLCEVRVDSAGIEHAQAAAAGYHPHR